MARLFAVEAYIPGKDQRIRLTHSHFLQERVRDLVAELGHLAVSGLHDAPEDLAVVGQRRGKIVQISRDDNAPGARLPCRFRLLFGRAGAARQQEERGEQQAREDSSSPFHGVLPFLFISIRSGAVHGGIGGSMLHAVYYTHIWKTTV